MARLRRWLLGTGHSPTPLPSPLIRAAARRRAGLTIRQVAQLLGTDSSSASRWERGRQPRPPMDARYAELIEKWLEEKA